MWFPLKRFYYRSRVEVSGTTSPSSKVHGKEKSQHLQNIKWVSVSSLRVIFSLIWLPGWTHYLLLHSLTCFMSVVVWGFDNNTVLIFVGTSVCCRLERKQRRKRRWWIKSARYWCLCLVTWSQCLEWIVCVPDIWTCKCWLIKDICNNADLKWFSIVIAKCGKQRQFHISVL